MGGGWSSDGAIASFSAGTDATIAVVTLFQPPGDNGGKIRVRIGPWLGVETPLHRIRYEGGLSIALRQEHFEAWGTLGLRGGAGVDHRGIGHWGGVVSWGIYGEELRDEACWGASDPEPPPKRPALFAITDCL